MDETPFWNNKQYCLLISCCSMLRTHRTEKFRTYFFSWSNKIPLNLSPFDSNGFSLLLNMEWKYSRNEKLKLFFSAKMNKSIFSTILRIIGPRLTHFSHEPWPMTLAVLPSVQLLYALNENNDTREHFVFSLGVLYRRRPLRSTLPNRWQRKDKDSKNHQQHR